jgi:hypothetical protein
VDTWCFEFPPEAPAARHPHTSKAGAGGGSRAALAGAARPSSRWSAGRYRACSAMDSCCASTGEADLPIDTDGPFLFRGQIPTHMPITVAQQPTSPAQTCIVTAQTT